MDKENNRTAKSGKNVKNDRGTRTESTRTEQGENSKERNCR